MASADKDRFRRVYKENFLLLRHFLGRFPGLGAEIEDMIHDVFLKFHRNMSKVPLEKESAYLLVAARNMARDHFKKVKRQKTDAMGELMPEQVDALWTSDSERDMEVALAGELIDAVSEKVRGGECFRLYYREGQGLKEIAARMNEPIGTIHSRIARMRERFRDELRILLEKSGMEKRHES